MFATNLKEGVVAHPRVAYIRYDAQRLASHLDIDGQSLVLRECGAVLSAASPSPQLQPLVSALHGSAAKVPLVMQTIAELLDGAAQRELQLRPVDAAAECYRAVWPESAGAAASAERAFVGLCDALQALQRAAPAGVRASAKEGNPFAWTVLLSDFGEHSRLQQDLAAYAAKFAPAGGAAVELELRWPSTFPCAPPEVRVVRPMLEPHSGGVVAGAMVLPRWLSPRAWSATPPARTLGDVGALLSALRTTLSEREAQVRLDTAAVYPLRAWRAAQRRLYAAPPREPSDAVSALGALRCVSASYATEVCATRLPLHFICESFSQFDSLPQTTCVI